MSAPDEDLRTAAITCGPGTPTAADIEAVNTFAEWLRTRPAPPGGRHRRPEPVEHLDERERIPAVNDPYDDPWRGEYDPGIDGDAPSRYDR